MKYTWFPNCVLVLTSGVQGRSDYSLLQERKTMDYRQKNIWRILYLRRNCRSELWNVTCGEGHMIWVTTGTRKMKDTWNRFELSLQAHGSVVKNLPASAGDARDVGLIPGLGRSPGEGNGNPLQYSCLENPKDRGAWQPTVHGITKSWTWPSTYGPTAWSPWSESGGWSLYYLCWLCSTH